MTVPATTLAAVTVLPTDSDCAVTDPLTDNELTLALPAVDIEPTVAAAAVVSEPAVTAPEDDRDVAVREALVRVGVSRCKVITISAAVSVPENWNDDAVRGPVLTDPL